MILLTNDIPTSINQKKEAVHTLVCTEKPLEGWI